MTKISTYYPIFVKSLLGLIVFAFSIQNAIGENVRSVDDLSKTTFGGGPDIPFSVSDGKALDFDGVDDHVDFGDISPREISDYTIELWFKMDAYPTEERSIFDIGVDWNIRQALRISENEFRYFISTWNGNGTDVSVIISDSLPSLNEWHHVAVSYNDTDKIGRLYLDGVEVGTETMVVIPANYWQFRPFQTYLGRSLDFDNNTYFAGQIDEFRYWATPRSQQEIIENQSCRQDVGFADGLRINASFEDGIAYGDNTTLTQTTNCSFDFDFAEGQLRNFSLTDSTSNFVEVNGIPACPKCNIGIENAFALRACPGEANGSIIITEAFCGDCVNGLADIEYSIDSINFQARDTFDNLMTGAYTLYIRDRNNVDCINSQLLTVDTLVSPPTTLTQDITANADADGIITIDALSVDDGSFDECTSPDDLMYSLSETTFDCNDLSGTVPCVNVSTIAGKFGESGFVDGSDTIARFMTMREMTMGPDGNLYVADERNRLIRKVTPEGVVTTFAGMQGVIGAENGNGTAASFAAPRGITTDLAGNVYVADRNNRSIRKITPNGDVTTFAGSGERGTQDGMGLEAQFSGPSSLIADKNGNLYVSDFNIIRKITPEGMVTTIAGGEDGNEAAASFNFVRGIAIDSSENLYVLDWGNHNVRKITPDGEVTTIAGKEGVQGQTDGTGESALFSFPTGIAIDANDVIYITDQGNGLIRQMTTSGEVKTLAGNLQNFDELEDGPGSVASFFGPFGIALAADGTIFVSDISRSVIRKIEPIEGCRSTRLAVTDEEGSTTYRLANVTLNCILSSVDNGLTTIPMKVSPNPIETNFNVQFTLEETQALDILLFSSNGQMVEQFFSGRQFSAGSHRLDLVLPVHLPTGSYFLTIINEGTPVSIPVLKQ